LYPPIDRKEETLKVIFVSSEVVPFAKTGGLADVAGALPLALSKLGHDVRVFMPLYRHVVDGLKDGRFEVEETDVELSFPVFHRMQKGIIWKSSFSSTPGTPVPVYFVEHDGYFYRRELYGGARGAYPDNSERFAFFSRAVLEAVVALGIEPDVFHLNDWQSALIAVYLKTIFAGGPVLGKPASLLTIHNLAYQGLFPKWEFNFTGLGWELFNWKELENHGKVNFLKGGIIFADLINTVSKKYSREIQTAEFGSGLEAVLRHRSADLYGILNGVDYRNWDPAADKLIPANYSPRDLSGKAKCKAELQRINNLPQKPNVPLVGIVSRLADQKGFDILSEAIEEIMKLDMQLVVLGTGSQKYHDLLNKIGKKYPDKTGINIMYDNKLAHMIEAGSDMFLMPSRYEPCGLNQMYSLKYGTVPVVRTTGGLADTITDCTDATLKAGTANGFSFSKYSADELVKVLSRAVETYVKKPKVWKKLVSTGMSQDFSWDRSAREYVSLYEKAMAKHG
jgi:starch synthase